MNPQVLAKSPNFGLNLRADWPFSPPLHMGVSEIRGTFKGIYKSSLKGSIRVSFRKFGVPYIGVLIKGILLCRVAGLGHLGPCHFCFEGGMGGGGRGLNSGIYLP